MTTGSADVYFIDRSVRFNSWWSGNLWAEGNLVFVQGRDHIEPALAKANCMITEETRMHQREIRGTARDGTIIGRLVDCTSFEDISKTKKLDIVYHTEHPDKNLDTVIDSIDADPILNDISKLKTWITTDGITFEEGEQYLP